MSGGSKLQYSARAARALGLLKSQANDVEIFVEDTGNPNMWVSILRRLLPQGVKLRSVNLLGGKSNVIEACRGDQAQDGRRKLYIIDGDLDKFKGKGKPRLRFLYRLRAYCIENLLISKAALVEVGCESSPSLSAAAVENILQFESTADDIENILKPLFAIYAATQACCPSVRNVQNSVHPLLSNPNTLRVDDRKVRDLRKSVLKECLNYVGRGLLSARLRQIRRRMSRANGFEVVSGKDYILPIFERKLRTGLRYRGTSEQLKVRLANSFNPGVEPALYRAVSTL